MLKQNVIKLMNIFYIVFFVLVVFGFWYVTTISSQLDSTRKYSLVNELARLKSLTKRAPNPNSIKIRVGSINS
jgi:cell division septal protein FtsQ